MVDEPAMSALAHGFAQRRRVQVRPMWLRDEEETVAEPAYRDEALAGTTICLRFVRKDIQNETGANGAFGTAWKYQNVQLPLLRSSFQ